jgi:urease accessory protein
MSRSNLLRGLVTGLALAPAVAFAHTGMGDAHDFLHGFVHPIAGIDHVLAMVAVGGIAAQLGGRAIWAVPASFMAMMAIAGACGMTGIAIPFSEFGIALSLVVLGAMVVFNVRLPVVAASALVALFAVAHGYAHGMEMPDNLSGVTFGAGFIIATALLHGIGVGLGSGVKRMGALGGQRLAQAFGGCVALVGLAGLVGGFAS